MRPKSIHVRALESRVARTAARFVDMAAREQLSVAELPTVKLPWYEIRNQADGGDDSATVLIYQEIGGSFGVTADQFAQDLEAITAPTIRLRINSPGGSLFDALAIHSTLLHHPAKVRTYVDGIAASAASVIAMAADPLDDEADTGGVVMMPGSQLMIHDASMVEDGNAAAMAAASTFLDRQSDNVADMYRLRAGGDVAEWRELMLAETWMFAREAVEMGLADRVEERPDPQTDERMRRSFDLGQFRYAGRRAAPEPCRRRATTTTRGGARTQGRGDSTQSGSDSMQVVRGTDAERRAAGERRAAAAADGTSGRKLANGRTARMSRRALPDDRRARLLDFPAQLRTKAEKRNGQDMIHLYGHAAVWNVGYEMWDEFGPYEEEVDAKAGVETLASDPDVAFLVNHRGLTMARTRPGPNGGMPTLELGIDDLGLPVDAWVNPKRHDVSDLVTAIDDGNVDQMSFAFMLDEGVWNDDFTKFRITRFDINRGDVSAVNYGANPYTDIAARSRELMRDLANAPVGIARAAMRQLEQRADLSGTSLVDVETRMEDTAPVVHTSTGRSIQHIEALLIED